MVIFSNVSVLMQLDHAVKIRSVPLTHERYDDVAVVLKEVMRAFVP